MRKIILSIFATSLLIGCQTQPEHNFGDSPKMEAARNIVESVNAKDSEQYVRDLSEDVIVTMYDGDVRLRGRNAIRDNRAAHFKNYPNARNELVHLVEIDNRVVMHDQVWLWPEVDLPSDIVEVFTFEDGKIVRIDVIQPANLFGAANQNP